MVAEHTKSRPSDKSKQHTSSSSKPAERKEKQSAGGGSSTNVTGGTHDIQKMDTVRSRPKAADKDGRKDPSVSTLCTCIQQLSPNPQESSALSVKSTNSLTTSGSKESKDSKHREHKVITS